MTIIIVATLYKGPLYLLQVDEKALAEMQDVIQMVKEEAFFIINYMHNRERRVFLILANDEGMMNGEYIFYGQTTEDIINYPWYQREVDILPLLVGFITVDPPAFTGPAWDQLAADVLQAYDDPHFDGQKRIDNINDVVSFAGK